MFPLQDTIPSRHVPVMTYALIVANVVVFLFELGLGPQRLEGLFYLLGLVPARLTHAQWAAAVGYPAGGYWTLLTSMFLHGGWFHILGNMWVLWIFGDNVEDRMGPLRFLIFYLLCGLAAALVQCAVQPTATVPTVGASGAIAGIMGAYLLLFPQSRVVMLLPIFFYPLIFTVPAFLFLAYWFLLQFFSGVASLAVTGHVGGVAWWAHIGGFLAGAVLHRWFLGRRRAWDVPSTYRRDSLRFI